MNLAKFPRRVYVREPTLIEYPPNFQSVGAEGATSTSSVTICPPAAPQATKYAVLTSGRPTRSPAAPCSPVTAGGRSFLLLPTGLFRFFIGKRSCPASAAGYGLFRFFRTLARLECAGMPEYGLSADLFSEKSGTLPGKACRSFPDHRISGKKRTVSGQPPAFAVSSGTESFSTGSPCARRCFFLRIRDLSALSLRRESMSVP